MPLRILYKDKSVEKQFSSDYIKTWRYPDQVKKKLLAAENFFKTAESLQDIANYIPFHFERLKGNRKEEWSIRLGNTGYRVTLIPCDNDEKPLLDGDILAKCQVIKIVLVTEVSNHYG